MDRDEELAETFKLNITVVSNDRSKEILFVSASDNGGHKDRRVLMWTRKQDLADNVFVEESQSGRLRVVKRVARRQNSTIVSELAVVGRIAKETKTHNRDLFIEFQGWYQFQEYVCFVMEYCEYGDISRCFPKPLSEMETRTVCDQLLKALEILHNILGIAHRDIKPQNILVVQKSPIQVKLADFGISKSTQEETELRTRIGTEGYMAPELFGFQDNMRESSSYTSAVDIWSLGCLLYYLLTKSTPFSTFTSLHDYAKFLTPFPEDPLYERGVSLDARFLIQKFLRPSPEERPKASQELLTEWTSPLSTNGVPRPRKTPRIPSVTSDMDDVNGSRSNDQRNLEESIKTSATPSSPQPDMDYLSLQLWDICTTGRTSTGDVEPIRVLLEAGADPNILCKGYTALHQTVRHCGSHSAYLEWVKILLEYGAKTEMRDHNGHTVLHWAIEYIDYQSGCHMIQLLLDRGVDVHAEDGDGLTPLQQMAEFFLEPERRDRALSYQRSIGPMMMFDSLRARGVSFESKTKRGMTPLLDACCKGRILLIRALISYGASVKASTNSGVTPLHAAAYWCQDEGETVKLLLKKGADPNSTSLDGTPLHYAAARRGNLESVKYLVQSGARINDMDYKKRTPLARAAIHNSNSEVINYLVKHGATCDVKNSAIQMRIRRAQVWKGISGAVIPSWH